MILVADSIGLNKCHTSIRKWDDLKWVMITTDTIKMRTGVMKVAKNDAWMKAINAWNHK